MSESIIRPARDEDIERIREIAKQAWAPIYAHFREAMGEEVGTPTGSSHEAKDVEDLLNDVL